MSKDKRCFLSFNRLCDDRCQAYVEPVIAGINPCVFINKLNSIAPFVLQVPSGKHAASAHPPEVK